MIGELARRLIGAGLSVTADELGEILWLAQRLPAADDAPQPAGPAPAPTEGEDAASEPAPPPPPAVDAQPPPSPPTPPAATRPRNEPQQVSLYATRMTGTIEASTLRVPGVASTGHPAELRRALQPFARRVSSRWRSVLDEDETAAQAADTGVWSPVYRPLRERWFDLALVVETGASMALWDEALADFLRTLRAHGGFRSITTHRWDDPAGLALSSADGRRRYPPSQIVRPDRRQLLLLVSDATSKRWRSGAAQALLRELGAATSVSVLQLLPPSVWRHTALGEPELTLYAERPGDPNHRLKALLPWWIDAQDAASSLGVPVVGLEPAALGQWARSMTARGGAAVPGVLLAAAMRASVSAAPAAAAAATPSPDVQPPPEAVALRAEAQVARYRAMVSRGAYDLAVFLSVPDPLTVPVMRLVQRAMLPATGMAELAEFFVGGLLERLPEAAAPEGSPPVEAAGSGGLPESAEAAYRFSAGVREVLGRALRYSEQGEINAQLRSVGRYLEQQADSGASFEAHFPSPGGGQRLTAWSLPFASLSRQVLLGEVAQVSPAETMTTAPPAEQAAQAAQVEPKAQAQDVSLHIVHRDEALWFSLDPDDTGTNATARQQMRAQELAKLMQAPRQTDGDAARLSDWLVPTSLTELLSPLMRHEDSVLTLRLEAATDAVPWEQVLRLELDGRRVPLATARGVVRQPADPQRRPAARDEAAPAVAWVVGELRGAQPPLPDAQNEARQVAAVLERSLAPGYEVRLEIALPGEQLLRGLQAQPLRILFVSGHGVRRLLPSGERLGIPYGGDSLLTASDIASMGNPPELVFLACNYLAGAAVELLQAGVAVVIAAHDVVAEHSPFPALFFASLAEGATLAQAVLDARRGTPAGQWAEYACYGDAQYRLVRPPAVEAEAEAEPNAAPPLSGAVQEAAAPPPEPPGTPFASSAATSAATSAADPPFDRHTQALADACLALPNRRTPSGVHTGVWFGDHVALTWASTSSEDRNTWSEDDTAATEMGVVDIWRHLFELASTRADEPLFVDDAVMAIARREGEDRRLPQVLALLAPSGEASPRPPHKIMPLAPDDAGHGASLVGAVLYCEGDRVRRIEVNVTGHERAGLLMLEPTLPDTPWPLPPEALGAPVVADQQCVGVVIGTGATSVSAIAKDSRTVRAALQALWVLRLHQGLGAHGEWVSSEAQVGQRLELPGADLSGIHLPHAQLSSAALAAARFSRANLTGTEFDTAELPRARFSGARLSGATFVGANLENANFRGADLRDANLSGARLRGARFDGAQLRGALWENAQFDRGQFEALEKEHPDMAVEREAEAELPEPPDDDTDDRQPLRVMYGHGRPKEWEQLRREAGRRLLAVGDAWFSLRQEPASPLLPRIQLNNRPAALSFTLAAVAGVPSLTGELISHPGLRDLLNSAARASWDAILLSTGTDDLYRAALQPAQQRGGREVQAAQRLLRNPSESEDFVSEEGLRTLEGYLAANVEQLMLQRDAGPSRGCPVFAIAHTLPTACWLEASASPVPWMAPSFRAYRIPEAQWPAIADRLMAALRHTLLQMASDTRRFPNLHVFDTATIPLTPEDSEPAGTGGDWSLERRPTAAYCRKLALAWSEQIESVLGARNAAA